MIDPMTMATVGSMAMGAFSKKKGSGGGVMVTSPWDQMKNTTMGKNTERLLGTNDSYINDMYSRVRGGRASEGYDNYEAKAMPWQQQQLRNRYYGMAGDRSNSMMGQVAQNAAMFGMNPRATAAQMNKATQSYMNDAGGIDQYFNQMRYNDMNQYAMALPGWTNQQAQTMTSMFQPSMVPYQTPAQSNPWGGLANTLAENGGLKGLSGMKFPWQGGTTGGTPQGFSSLNFTSKPSSPMNPFN